MVKKQALAVLVILMSFIGSAFGLGLGDIEVKSNLNDPLEAEIELIQLQGLTAGEVLPTLASNDDFRRAGVERSFFLSNIQFRVKESESGKLVITLQTRQAVREPFLNFLVEVNWPGGRLLKEYTVLLDPPVFDTGLAVDALIVESSPNNSGVVTDLVTTTVIDQGEVAETTVAPAVVEPRDESLPTGQYRVQRNDTLWEIALSVPDRAGYSPQQVMLAIQDLNPEAFLNNNINRVKAGSVLNLPDGRQISTRTLDEAIAEVQAQNRGAAPNLRAPVTGSSEVQLSATDSTSSALPTGDGEKNPDGYLELTADSESSTTTASGEASATIDQLQNQLSVAEELNDQFERERDELESRVEELQEQIAIMERLLDVQNSDLAEVQQALTADTTADETVTPTTDTASTEAAATDDSSVDTTADASSSTTQASADVQPTPTPTPTPAPAPVQTAPEGIMGFVSEMTRSVSNWVMGSIQNMAITGAAVLILILVPFYIRSKRAGGDQTLGEMAAEVEETFEEEEFTTELDDDLLAEVEDEFEEEVVSDELETLDAVVEAEMYMAYQKYDQAEEKLKEAFSEHPDRTDVGLKLLEVYAETGDANAFNELESRLSLDAEQQGQVSDLRSKLPLGAPDTASDLDSDLMDDDLSLDLDMDSSVGSPADNASSDLDFDLDLESAEPESADESLDFDLDLGSADDELAVDLDDSMTVDLNISDDAETESLSSEPEELSADLDFSLDLGDLDESTDDDSSGDLDFSLEGLDDSALETEDEPSIELEAEAESLDFSLDLDESTDLDLTAGSEEDESDLDLTLNEPVETSALDMDLDLSESDDSVDAGTDELDMELDLGSLDAEPAVEDLPSFDVETELTSEPSTEIEVPDTLGEVDDVSLDMDLDLDTSLESLDEDSGLLEPEIDIDSSDPLEQLANSLDSEAELEEDEFDFLSGNDEASTKLDLARAYIEMDDREGARDILEEVASEGSEDQKAQAQELMGQL